jgi:hypothetical protein
MAEICHIEAMTSGGPRYNATRAEWHTDILDNLIVLCPNHHRLIDSDPITYSVAWLRKSKEAHERSMLALLRADPDLTPLAKRVTAFHESLEIWNGNSLNSNEHFWHQLFVSNPHLLAQAVPNCIIQIGENCYVGGKSIQNRGGKLADFLYSTKSTQNVVIVEIKTPATQLVGREYRNRIHSMSEDLSGAVVQVLTYRNQFLKDFHALRGSSESTEFHAFDPMCLVIAGNLQAEVKAASQRASFDLFRANSGVTIITYDELFAKIDALVNMFKDVAAIGD